MDQMSYQLFSTQQMGIGASSFKTDDAKFCNKKLNKSTFYLLYTYFCIIVH